MQVEKTPFSGSMLVMVYIKKVHIATTSLI